MSDAATPVDQPITEEWLRSAGFKWDTPFNDGKKHWLLWVADATNNPESPRLFMGHEDLGVELMPMGPGSEAGGEWHCWVRADYCGRYSRFVHVRHMRYAHEVVKLIEGLIGYAFDPTNAMYGSLRHPISAQRMREENQRLERRMAIDWGKRVERETGADPDKIEKIRP